MRLHLCLAACAGFLCIAAPGVAQGPLPVSLGQPVVVGADEEFGAITAAEVAPNGNVYVLDHLNARITAFSPEGRVLWRFGRKGRGPGEFQLPYRLATRDDSGVLVLDTGAGEVTAISPAGAYLERYTLPFAFGSVDGIVAAGPGEVVIAGTVPTNPAARRHGAHRFRAAGSRLAHAGSFAPLPVVRDARVLRMWGAGSLTRSPGGELVYARRLPYEVYGYTASGQHRWRLRPPVRTSGMPDDAYLIEQQGAATRYGRSGADVTWIGRAWKLADGKVLASRRSGGRTHWDLLSPQGALIGSQRLPEEWGGIVGFDPARRLVWISGTHDDEPVLFRMTFSLAPS